MTVLELLIPVLGVAALFILFAVFRPERECAGGCSRCTAGSCPIREEKSHE